VIVGVHTKNGVEKIDEFIKDKNVNYAVCVDAEGKTKAAYKVNSYPDYYVVGRKGNLRFADLANSEVERAVKYLLAEGAQDVSEAEPAKAEYASHPYTLSTCPVSGEALGSMGDPIVRTVEGREIKLCCKGCLKALDKNPAKVIAVVDAAHAEQQRAYYPQICPVLGESLIVDGKDTGVDVMVGNRLFRTCCKRCAKKVREDPAKFAASLDTAVIKAQSASYPLGVCLVDAKGKLGDVKDRVQRVVSNRLVQFCCKDCSSAFDKDPATYLAKLDAAWIEAKSKKADPPKVRRLDKGGKR
jgi:hypothetical protein